MTPALIAIVLAAIEAEFMWRYQRAGDALRMRKHGGWVIILFVFACSLAFLSAAIG